MNDQILALAALVPLALIGDETQVEYALQGEGEDYSYTEFPVAESTNAFSPEVNLAAFKMVIRNGEGTADAGGYSRLFGGSSFSSFADHPNIKITKSGYTSTAAGAFQIIIATWKECKSALGLSDFTPASQERACEWLIQRAGAWGDVLAGRFDVAVKKCAGTWASLPGSPYGQPTISSEKARAVYSNNGGSFA